MKLKIFQFLIVFFAFFTINAQEEVQLCHSDLLLALLPPDNNDSVDWYYFPWQSVRLLPNLSIAMYMITTLEDFLKIDLDYEYWKLRDRFKNYYSSNHQLVGSQYALQYWEYNGHEIYSTADLIPGEIPGAIAIKKLENGLYYISMALFYKFSLQQKISYQKIK